MTSVPLFCWLLSLCINVFVSVCVGHVTRYVKAWARKGDIEYLQKEYHKAMDSYQKGLEIEDGNKLCRDGLDKVTGSDESHGGDRQVALEQPPPCLILPER
jgi:hypothetical protein